MFRSSFIPLALVSTILAGSVAIAAPATRPAGADTGPLTATAPEAVGFDSQRLRLFDDYMAKVVADGRVAGMSVMTLRHGKVVEFKTWGQASIAANKPMQKDTIFRIYSMSKPITGVAMMTLFEQGKWRLDDPVTRFVPEFKDLRVVKSIGADGALVLEPMTRPPTMREIMSHTAGFGYGLAAQHPVDKLYREKGVFNSSNLKEMIDRTATIPLMFQPGTNWSYSSAVDIQGYIVEKITGQKFGDYLAQHIFKPLKMNDTGFYTGAEKAGRLAAIYVYDQKAGKIVEGGGLFGNPMPDYTKPPALESGGGGMVSTATD